MFLIGKHGLPKTRTEFERALRDGFSIFRAPDLRLEITGEFPRFERVAIDLSGGTAPATPPPGARGAGDQQTSLDIGELELRALPLFLEGGRIRVHLRASGVEMLLRGGDNEPASL